MLLEEVSRGGHLLLPRLEQLVNDGSPSGFTNRHTTSTGTAPGIDDLVSYLLPELGLFKGIEKTDYGHLPEKTPLRGDSFYIHPDMLADQSIGTPIQSRRVYPLSSARTVSTAEEPFWHIKLGYKGMIGRFPRDLGHRQASSAIEVSSVISAALRRGAIQSGTHILRELFARIAQEQPTNGYEWGWIFRDPIPYPTPLFGYRMIPAFSFFSTDRASCTDPPLLVQMIAQSNESPIEYMLARILFPLIDTYFNVLLTCGLQVEAQAQNILFLLDEEVRPSGVVIRDAESIDKDLSLIDALSIDATMNETTWKCLNRDDYNYQIMHSFMFDFKLGEYLLEPMIHCAKKHFHFDSTKLYDKIKCRVQQYLRLLPDDFMPFGRWYYYDEIVHDRSKPRPYKYSMDLKFRPY